MDKGNQFLIGFGVIAVLGGALLVYNWSSGGGGGGGTPPQNPPAQQANVTPPNPTPAPQPAPQAPGNPQPVAPQNLTPQTVTPPNNVAPNIQPSPPRLNPIRPPANPPQLRPGPDPAVVAAVTQARQTQDRVYNKLVTKPEFREHRSQRLNQLMLQAHKLSQDPAAPPQDVIAAQAALVREYEAIEADIDAGATVEAARTRAVDAQRLAVDLKLRVTDAATYDRAVAKVDEADKLRDSTHMVAARSAYDDAAKLFRGGVAGNVDAEVKRLLANARRNVNEEGAFAARRQLHEVLRLQPGNADAAALMKDVDRFLVFTNDAGIRFLRIPAGEVKMPAGDRNARFNRDDAEQWVTVKVASLWVQETEVTQEQFTLLMGANPSLEKNPKAPVTSATLRSAAEFAQRLSKRESRTYRLPTEPEWEYACRAGAAAAAVVDENDVEKLMQRQQGRWQQAQAVRTGPPNAWGLYDMDGNAPEICSTWFELPSDPIEERPAGRQPPRGRDAVRRPVQTERPSYAVRSGPLPEGAGRFQDRGDRTRAWPDQEGGRTTFGFRLVLEKP